MKKMVFSVLWLFIASALTAQGCKSSTNVRGVVMVTGNEPFTELVIKSDKGYYRLTNNDKAQELREHYQNQEVMVEGCTVKPKNTSYIPRLIADIEVKKYTLEK